MSTVIKIWYFQKVKNVGDLLTVWILRRVLKQWFPQKTVHLKRAKSYLDATILGIGSILQICRDSSFHGHIWGTGSFPQRKKMLIPDSAKVWGVRGKKTQKSLCNPGTENIILGDPGLLLGYLWPMKVRRIHTLGIIPHYVDEAHIRRLRLPGVVIISTSLGVVDFLGKLLKCQCIFSSSLHGLVLSDSYGIPNRRFVTKTSHLIRGGGWKYTDYYSIFPEECRPTKVIRLTKKTNLRKWYNITRKYYHRPGLENIQHQLSKQLRSMLRDILQESGTVEGTDLHKG